MLLTLHYTVYTAGYSEISLFLTNTNWWSGCRTNSNECALHLQAKAYNRLLEAHNQQALIIQKMQDRMANLEDRSRRNNVKFRGIPESVSTADIVPFLHTLLKTILPDCTPSDLLINRAHCLRKPTYLPDSVPRNIIARLHYFTIKERLMLATKQSANFPEPYNNISIYLDISPATAQKRREFTPTTKALWDNWIQYRWDSPLNYWLLISTSWFQS